MKALLTSTALAVTLICAPAFAQEVPAKPDATPQISQEKEGTLTVEGVTPAQALGAIDTSKLVDSSKAPAAEGDPTAKAYVAAEANAPVEPKDTADAKPIQTAGIENEIAPIPEEVQAVVGSGARYTTEDLVNAQLAAVDASPAPATITTTTTTSAADTPAEPAEPGIRPTSSEGSPVFDKAINPADWSISADAGNAPTEPS